MSEKIAQILAEIKEREELNGISEPAILQTLWNKGETTEYANGFISGRRYVLLIADVPRLREALVVALKELKKHICYPTRKEFHEVCNHLGSCQAIKEIERILEGETG